MKYLILTVLSLVFIQPCFAEHLISDSGRDRPLAKPPMYCNSSKGYELMANLDRKTATLKKDHEALQYGDLSCVTLYPKCEENAKDCGPILICKSKSVNDAGFEVQVTMVPEAKKFKGVVKMQSYAGPKTISKLTCVPSIR